MTGEKGDELADYSFNYSIKTTGPSVLKSTSFFYYDAGTDTPARATATGVSTASAQRIVRTYKGTLSAEDQTKLQSESFMTGEKGDEIADYSFNYSIKTTGPSVLKSTSFFYYDTGTTTPARATATGVSTDSAQRIVRTYKGTLSAEDQTKLQSESFMTGEKGDEIADYSFNYSIKTTGPSVLKSTSFFYYDAGTTTPARATATGVSTDSAQRIVQTYKGT